MNTTVSIPQKLCKQADKIAIDMGISQSKLFTAAIKKYVEEYKDKNIANKFNKAYSKYVPNEQILKTGRANVRELLKNDTW
ncbi:MAG: ribbon-helix-helix protein, CopG family [Chitinispirillales bacterium]|nr:ribbon-helix-helix protein, CopG family [Chitinispirillales bacterium]